MSFAADDYEAIRRRAEEIKAERNLALTGSTLDEPVNVLVGEGTGVLTVNPPWPYAMTADYDPA